MTLSTDKFTLIDTRLGGALASSLQEWRDAKVSAPAIARLISKRTDVTLSPETIRRWLRAVA